MHVAGVVELAPVADLALDDLPRQLDVNLVAPCRLTRACCPRCGRPAAGRLRQLRRRVWPPAREWAAYAASKYGLRAIADALRAEEVAHGVRVTQCYLGRASTPMQEKVHEQEGKAYDPPTGRVRESVAVDHPARARPAGRRDDRRTSGSGPARADSALALRRGTRSGQSSGSSSRASQVANRSTAVSNSGCVSVNSWSRSASQARVTSSSPRRLSSSSMPRSVKYMRQ